MRRKDLKDGNTTKTAESRRGDSAPQVWSEWSRVEKNTGVEEEWESGRLFATPVGPSWEAN